MPDRDPVAIWLAELIRAASESILLLPPLNAPFAERDAAIDKIHALMMPFVSDTMLCDVDLGLEEPRAA